MLTYAQFLQGFRDILMLGDEPVGRDALLVEELGLQSIDVVELVERIEAELGRPLEGLDLSEAETVGQLFDGLARAAGAPADPVVAALKSWFPEDPLAGVATISELWSERTRQTPDRTALVCDDRPITYGELGGQADRVARALTRQGIGKGDRVVLVLGNSPAFFAVLYGILRIGAVAVPTYHVPQPDRIARIVGHCGAAALVTGRALAGPVRRRLVSCLDDASPAFLSVDDLLTDAGAPTLPDPPVPSDLALLQYTSGTTGDAKGVMLTHAALLANIRQALPPAGFRPEDVFVSWLPVYHDMGLVTMTLCPFYLGARLVLLPVQLDPARWLGAIATHGGTVTAAPDFAYRYALRVGGDLARFDCSTLRMALVAAEPVRARTIERFEQALGLRDVLRPGYGLAESCVAVSFYPLTAAGIAQDAHGNVCVGPPVPGTTLTIRDDAGEILEPGAIGEICLQSPSQTSGYFRNPQANAALFTADGAVRTGDIGHLDAAGQLTVVDRRKNLLVVAGRSLSPKELEQVVDTLEEVERSMAVGLDDGGDAGEQVHLVVETTSEDPALPRRVRRLLQDQMAVRVRAVHLVEPNALPRTYNGKYRYAEMRQRLLACLG